MRGPGRRVSADEDSEVDHDASAQVVRRPAPPVLTAFGDRPLPLPFPNAGCWGTSWFNAANPTEGKVSRPLSLDSPDYSSPVRRKVSAKRNR